MVTHQIERLKSTNQKADCRSSVVKSEYASLVWSDNVELVLGSTAIPDSGTASVRARPTVKHHMVSEKNKLFTFTTAQLAKG